MKLYVHAIIGILILGLTLHVAPRLISARDDFLFMIGVAWIILFGALAIAYFSSYWREWRRLFPVVALLFLTACDNITAGHVGVLVNKLGSTKGVQTTVVGPGRYWVGINEELHKFPTFTVTDTWTKRGPQGDQSITFQTVEGLSVNADIGITFHFDEKKISEIFQKYRRGVEEITDIFLRNVVRYAFVTAASTKSVEYIYGAGKAELTKTVETLVRQEVGDIGIVIENVTVVSEFRVPESVIASINAKITATQMAQQRQNEVAQAKAEADKLIEAARGQAESTRIQAIAQAQANKILAESISSTLVQYKAIEKWNGELPRLNGGGAVPFINVDPVK